MITFLELVHHGQSFNFDGATMFDAGGRSAQTFPLYMFHRRLTIGKIAAPPVGEIYRAE